MIQRVHNMHEGFVSVRKNCERKVDYSNTFECTFKLTQKTHSSTLFFPFSPSCEHSETHMQTHTHMYKHQVKESKREREK